MGDTNISWTDKVWNPVVGCSRVSAGCENCYAETFANRLEAMGQARYKGLTVIGKHGARWTGEVRQVPEVLAAPLGWRKGLRVFVNSMSDLFHEAVPFEYVAAVFGVMSACPQHKFQVLTKRPERALEFFAWVDKRGTDGESMFPDDPREWRIHQLLNVSSRKAGADVWSHRGGQWPLPNVHLGVSVEDQRRADERIPILLRCPAAVRWVSAEPLLGPISMWADDEGVLRGPGVVVSGGMTPSTPDNPPEGYDDSYPGLDWVVVGGESGAGHRPADPAWIDSIVSQCTAVGVPVFVKQDSGPKPGKQGRLSDATWARKEFPETALVGCRGEMGRPA